MSGNKPSTDFGLCILFAKWGARHIARLIIEYEAALPKGARPNWVLGNYDQHRIAWWIDPARVAAMLLLTLRGTPTIYYGDEISMHDVEIPPAQVQNLFR